MIIQPQTSIKLLTGIKLDSDYFHTIYFSNKSTQASYFLRKVAFSFDNTSYQNKSDTTLKIQENVENLYHINYLMFNNGQKWIYAFVTEKRRINNRATELTYQIDVFQTWFLDCTLGKSFVLRENVIDDTIGANIQPENVELGDFIISGQARSGHMNNWQMLVACTFTKDEGTGSGDDKLNIDNLRFPWMNAYPGGGGGANEQGYKDFYGGMWSNIYSGCTFVRFNTATALSEFLERVTKAKKIDGIVGIYMFPADFSGVSGEPPSAHYVDMYKNHSSIDGYVPRNKKLFTAPYNVLQVSNMDGGTAQYSYEHFSSNPCRFKLRGVISTPPTAHLYPLNYKRRSECIDEILSMGNFPQCSYNTDTFKAWLAQNMGSMVIDGVTAVGGAVATVASGGAAALATGGASVMSAMNLGQNIKDGYNASQLPPKINDVSSPSGMVAIGYKDYIFMNKTICSENAKKIDDYFTRFGYAINQLKQPQISHHLHNYIELHEANLVGSIDASDLTLMKETLARGITFWTNGDRIGEY